METNVEATKYRDYRNLLEDVFVARTQSRRSYSLRAYARDLRIPISLLSDVLNRKRNISHKHAGKVAASLGLDPDDQVFFTDLISLARAKTTEEQRIAELRISGKTSQSRAHLIELDLFRVISDWHHYAILELTSVKGFRNDPKWIASRLGISIVETNQAIERLKRLKLVRVKNGTLVKTNKLVATKTDSPSEALRKFNRQMLEKAIAALEKQSVTEKDFTTISMAIDPKRIPEAKIRIKKFRRELCKFLESGNQSELYCASFQLFRLTDKKIEDPRGDKK